MLFCEGQCDFSACKDYVCLLSTLVKHVLIAYGLLGSFSSFASSIFYWAVNYKIQNKSARMEWGFLVSWSWFGARTHASHDRTWDKESKGKLWVRLRSIVVGKGVTVISSISRVFRKLCRWCRTCAHYQGYL